MADAGLREELSEDPREEGTTGCTVGAEQPIGDLREEDSSGGSTVGVEFDNYLFLHVVGRKRKTRSEKRKTRREHAKSQLVQRKQSTSKSDKLRKEEGPATSIKPNIGPELQEIHDETRSSVKDRDITNQGVTTGVQKCDEGLKKEM